MSLIRRSSPLPRFITRHCTADIRRAQEFLRFAPAVSWEDGLRELVAWCREAGSADHFASAQGELERHGLLTATIAPAQTKESGT